MAGRALAFSDPRVIALVNEHFVAVAADDWYQRRRSDPTGRYFRYIVEQVQPPPDLKSTLQGIYVFTASGRLLAHRNSGKHADLTIDVIQRALDGWRALPAKHTQPGALRLPELSNDVWDRRFAPSAPEGGLVLNVTTRALERDAAGRLTACQMDGSNMVGTRPAHDHVWLTPQEKEALIAAAETHARFSLPSSIIWRLARFHLVDNTRGEPEHWKWEHVRQADLKANVVEQSSQRIRIGLNGAFAMTTDADQQDADRGYVGHWCGAVEIDLTRRTIDQVRLVALGDHWGQGRWTPGARPGRLPLGVLMLLSDNSQPSDAVPPQGARSPQRYFNAELNR